MKCNGEAHTNAFIDYCGLCMSREAREREESARMDARDKAILKIGIHAGSALASLDDLVRALETDGVYSPETAAELRSGAAELQASARMLVGCLRAALVKP